MNKNILLFSFLFCLFCSVEQTNAQQFSWQKFSVAATFEPNMQLYYRCHKNGLFSDSYSRHHFNIPTILNFRTNLFSNPDYSGRTSNENHFTFLSGVRVYYSLNENLSLGSGLLYLHELYHIVYDMDNSSPHYNYRLYEYFTDIIRLPLAIEWNNNKSRKVSYPLALGLNFDFLMKDVVYYGSGDKSGYDVNYNMKFYRIVPEIMWGPDFKIYKSLHFKFIAGLAFNAIYQRTVREFIPLNTSLSFKMMLYYNPSKI